MESKLIKKNLDILVKIYKNLADEQSEYIFKNRLLYSISNEADYIQNIVKTTDYGKKFVEILNSCENVYIFGAGIWGTEITKIWGNQIKGILDNDKNKQGMIINNVKIYTPDEVINENFNGKIIISTKKYNNDILEQLYKLGVKTDKIVNIADWIKQAENEQYFSLDKLSHASEEVFVDVGSLDGNTAVNFAKWSGNYKKIYCFEPDKENVKKCISNINKSGISNKTKLITSGAWSFDGELYIKADGNGLSYICSENNNVNYEKVVVGKLDTVLKNERVTFIKMDIEGAEFEALRGAEEIISVQRPKLAISIYHKPEDIVELINLIMSYNDKYRFYLRHHSIVSWDTVLYAI